MKRRGEVVTFSAFAYWLVSLSLELTVECFSLCRTRSPASGVDTDTDSHSGVFIVQHNSMGPPTPAAATSLGAASANLNTNPALAACGRPCNVVSS